MSAYFDFFVGFPEFKVARQIVPKYVNYPVTNWRLLFLDVKTQLQEYDLKKFEGVEEVKRPEETSQPKEPQLNAKIEGNNILLDHLNLDSVELKYYLVDMESLFSRTPFITEGTESFNYLFPAKTETIRLDPSHKTTQVSVNKEFIGKNTIINVVGGKIEKLLKFFSASLAVYIQEKYGELQCTDLHGGILSQVYVKVYARNNNGTVSFYKDGYTDIRGRFDYLSLNASKLENIKRFAFLVVSDTHGSAISECDPPGIPVKIGTTTQMEEVNWRLKQYEEEEMEDPMEDVMEKSEASYKGEKKKKAAKKIWTTTS